jgi:hypothetical protein
MTTVTTVLQVSGDDVSPDDTPSTAHQSGGLTPDEELLCACGSELAGGDPERVRRIAAELATAFAAMAAVTGAVSVFGSARTPASAPEHALARQVASVLGRRGFSIITGGGPGLMEAASPPGFQGDGGGEGAVLATFHGCGGRRPLVELAAHVRLSCLDLCRKLEGHLARPVATGLLAHQGSSRLWGTGNLQLHTTTCCRCKADISPG